MAVYKVDETIIKKVEEILQKYSSMTINEIRTNEEKNSYINILQEFENNLNEINHELQRKKELEKKEENDLMCLRKELEESLSSKTKDNSKIKNTRLLINNYTKSKEEYNKEISALEELKMSLQKDRNNIAHGLGGRRYLDKDIILENVKRLAKEQNVKIGDIENDSGNSIGYMARLSKNSSISLPNIDFIVTASKKLNVGVDELLKKESVPNNPKEKMISDFIKKINRLTEEGKIDWTRTPRDRFFGNDGPKTKTDYPLAEIAIREFKNEFGGSSVGPIEIYKSLFKEESVELLDDIVYSSFDNNENKIYISPVKYGSSKKRKVIKKNKKKTSDRTIFEVYIVDEKKQKIKPLFNTEDIKELIENDVDSLYKEALVNANNIIMDKDIEGILNDFLMNDDI